MNSITDIHIPVIDFFDLTPLPLTASIATIGNFDGVHLGHQAIIAQMVEEGRSQGKPVVAVTLYPNPFDFFHSQSKGFYLTSPEEKEIQLLSLGVDQVITFAFNQGLANLSASDFLKGLKEKIDLSLLVIGRDYALGKNREGTLPVIQAIGKELSFHVEMIQSVKFCEQEISSTNIRQRLDEGDVADAARMLGRAYTISGVVVHGSDRGSRIGLPTANLLHWPKKKLPAVGVYATRVDSPKGPLLGITNIGFRPTFEQQESPNIETYILDFDDNIYGEKLTLHFIQKIRDERKFEGVESLLDQIEHDKTTARRIFEND
jgi:riboflavin kinase/FMN adenylyltransferase